MTQVVYNGKIAGEFYGFDDELLFKMKNGTYWIQARYKYWYHYANNPNAMITLENGAFFLTVADKSIQVRKISSVIESRINGVFKGWDGTTIYKLQNGQVWQQASYMYEYKYAYMPDAIVYEVNGGYKMSVEGTTADVRRV